LATDRIVVIGGVACGPKAAARARRLSPETEISIVDRGPYISFAGCGLPYYVGGTVKQLEELWTTKFAIPRDSKYFKDVKNIDVRTLTEAISINRDEKTVKLRNLANGEESDLEYGQLVLATGASPASPPIVGLGLERVFHLHSPSEAAAIRELIEADEIDHAVVIGAGSIGIESVESFFAHAVDVTVIERMEQIMPGLLDPDMATCLTWEMRKNDIEILTSEKVIRLESTEDGKVSKVITDKREIETDMVLLAAGVRPNVALAKDAGLEIGETGAIAVNECMQTSDKSIFAGGDCVECNHRLTGNKIYAPLGSTANKHGRIIGSNLAGESEQFPGVLGTSILKSLGINIAKTGLTAAECARDNIDYIETLTPSEDCAHYYPGGKRFLIKLIADRSSQKLLGAQLLGPGDVSKRIDVIASMMTFGATLKDISDLDLSYSPPFSTAVDALAQAANHTRNRIKGTAQAVTGEYLKEKTETSEDFVILDVRQPEEFKKSRIENDRVLNIALTELRAAVKDTFQDKEIIIICKTGLRSYEACRTLRESGLLNVKYLEGGLIMWEYLKA
jgi:NADPH-dependent 2,4-dienoyl-CoA reductase/sulfur reductase-like enzyme/rhodanese-related sulfurtransferase